ncbi:hypothetical protein FSP39_023535 [Pinctada imbricata]|uniref:Uncharacterized protein n=1 Tax=Pinctada imbricata TaxID=66713 RepID=A0AA88XNP2_PINIB|nr:hypothetical protein FSP39_023535 [Pinctada imbricata]
MDLKTEPCASTIGDLPLFIKQFSQADSLRLRNTLVQILEELKQRRKNDVENEDRIKWLVQEKYELERRKKQHEVYRECMETEIIVLKDQIRNLQLRKYTLEKNLRDQDRKFQLEVQSSETHLHQMSKVEQEFNEIKTRCKEITENDIGHLKREGKCLVMQRIKDKSPGNCI